MENESKTPESGTSERNASRFRPDGGEEPVTSDSKPEQQRVADPAADEQARDGQTADAVEAAIEDTSLAPETLRRAEPAFPIVGLGASAGGLAAIERFCAAMSREAEVSLALVVVQHLDPDRKSLLSDLLRRYTGMTVLEVADGMEVQAGHVYIIPPGKDMALLNGRLHLTEPANPRGLRLPIDFFFRSLAQDCGEKAIGVVLSGTGTDGTLGLKAVKEAGGLVVVQHPDSAEYDGMPLSAIATGLADFILPPGEMPDRLLSYTRRVFSNGANGTGETTPTGPRQHEPLHRIFALLRSHTRHDFSHYKHNTVLRRLERRMAVHQIETLAGYARHLQENTNELSVLFRELLIGVTNFFRDPDAFAVLEERVIPAICAGKRNGDPVRVWVPGCSTGEEAYSIAILMQEYLSTTKTDLRPQIFATDIDAEAIEQARAGLYTSGVAADVSPERLSRFFIQEKESYRIKKVVRDMVVFAEQNVADDPPFSRMDLVSCRNLLIYMSPQLQHRVLPLFYYALLPNSYLFLGSSESIGEFTDLFSPVDRKWKIFVRKPGLSPQRAPLDFSRVSVNVEPPARRSRSDARREAPADVRQVLEQALLAQYTPAAVVVNHEGNVVYIHGRTGYYLEPASGEASLNIVRMAREGVRLELTTALRKAIMTQDQVEYRGLSVRANGGSQTFDLLVRPLNEDAATSRLYLVIFQPVQGPEMDWAAPQETEPGDKDQRITGLQRELHAKEEYLRSTIEELETSNEEMASTNEELQSANEELQSTNEELETSKEELQSVNEELMTVNVELQKKIEEVTQVNNDLSNLLAGTGIGTVFVDHQLLIQRYTPAVTDIINLIQADLGRPVAHIVSNLVGYSDLIGDVTSVLNSLIPKEREVQIRTGRWYLMRIQPYRTLENVIEGAVITFVDITVQKQMQAALDESQRLRLEVVYDPVVMLEPGGAVIDASRAAQRLFGYDRAQFLTMRAADLVQPASARPLLEALDRAETDEEGYATVALQTGHGVSPTFEARVRRVGSGNNASIFVVLRDIGPGAQPDEARLRHVEREDRLTAFMRDLTHAGIVFDLAGRIVSWNPVAERVYGWPESEVVGEPEETVIPESDRDQHRASVQALREGREVGPYESGRLTRDGKVLPVMMTVLALVDGDGSPYAVASIERLLARDGRS